MPRGGLTAGGSSLAGERCACRATGASLQASAAGGAAAPGPAGCHASSALNPALQGSVSARVEVGGTAAEPKPSARFTLQQPGAMGLRSAETWQGSWQPAQLQLSTASTRIEAQLNAGELQWLSANKGAGSLALRRRGDRFAWSAREWALSTLQLSLPGQSVLPLSGVLRGRNPAF